MPNDMNEALVRRRVDDLARAIRAKDIDGVAAFYARDVVSFDIEPPLRYTGVDRKRRAWESVFAAYSGTFDYAIDHSTVVAQRDVAFVCSLNHIRGTLENGRVAELWLRWTACFRLVGGEWLIVHDHVSVPADLAHGRALLSLTP